jgi:AcrR family transcriptional regulator
MTNHSRTRKEDILAAALRLSARHGYMRVTREVIAEACNIAPSAVSYHYKTMAQLRRDVVRHAIQKRALAVVGQAIAAKDPHASRVPDDLRKAALAAL